MREINAKELLINPFSMIEDAWFLVTSVKDGKVNAMTAASGALGHMFRKEVAYINIRPARLTHDYIEASGVLSLSFLPDTPKNREILKYLGSVSGKTEDKLSKIPLTVAFYEGIPYFQEADTVFLCRTLFRQAYAHESFLDARVEESYYPLKDYHDLYICEIRHTLVSG